MNMMCIAALLPLALCLGCTGEASPLRAKIDAGKNITVVYFGGSITQGAMTWPQEGVNAAGEPYDYREESDPEQFSWRARTFKWLQQNYEKRPGQFHMVNAAVGATDSELGAYRLAEHVLPHHPDLLFIEFAINDNGAGKLSDDPEADLSIYRRLSSIVSRVRAANPDVVIVIPVSTARRLNEASYQYFQAARKHHLDFANCFHIPFVDIDRAFYEAPLPDGVTLDNLFDGPDEPGCAVHPSPRGHLAYANAVCAVLEDMLEGRAFSFAQPRRTDFFGPWPRNPRFIPAAALPEGGGWTHQPGTAFVNSPGHVLRETPILFTDQAGARFELTFEGTAVYLFGQQHYPGLGNITGKLEVAVDGQPLAVFSDGAHRVEGVSLLQRMMPCCRGLDPARPHVLTITTMPVDDNTPTRVGLHGIGIDAP